MEAGLLSYKAGEEAVAQRPKGWRGLLPFLGPAFIASVAYIDPGNYATNIAAGTQYGYRLLWVVLAANLMAILVQSLSMKLGLATGKDLAELIRDRNSRWLGALLWIQGEMVVIFTDLAEFLGGTLGIHLLFGLDLLTSAIIAAAVAFLLLEFQRMGVRPLEGAITLLVFVVTFSFVVEMFLARFDPKETLKGMLIPSIPGPDAPFLAAGILGATVMPHAIYLHSALTKRRIVGKTDEEKQHIYRMYLWDVGIAMGIAAIINMSMLVVAAALFAPHGVSPHELDEAHHWLGVLLGPLAAVLFAIGLTASGLSSSSVGILAGDVIMRGFIHYHIPLYLRRALSTIPPFFIILTGRSVSEMLLISQVVLSFGIGIALIPLLRYTGDQAIMGSLKNAPLTQVVSYLMAAVVLALNAYILWMAFHGIDV
ncbi:MAG: Nramp family divalent metal transporter [Clostridiales bacterium]|nr:Nramp family divalent metal transporter [Clostridiales bacterium]MBT9259910.1 Nramp family divalent metal transporter [Clostridiales bacterium]